MPAARHRSKLTTPSALPVKPTANILADGYPRRDVLHSGIRLYRLFFPSWYLTRFHSLNHCDGATLGCKSLWEQMAAQGVEDLPGHPCGRGFRPGGVHGNTDRGAPRQFQPTASTEAALHVKFTSGHGAPASARRSSRSLSPYSAFWL